MLEKWEQVAKQGMLRAYVVMASGIIGFALLGKPFFKLIGSNAEFPEMNLWLLLGLAFFSHRYGAMHTQLYTTVNKVNSHISDSISSVIMVSTWFLFNKSLDVYVFPIGMLASWLGFYVWYAAYYSYKEITSNPIRFEMKAVVFPFIFLLIFTTIMFGF